MTRRSPGCNARSGTGPAATWRSPVGSGALLFRRPRVARSQHPPSELRWTRWHNPAILLSLLKITGMKHAG